MVDLLLYCMMDEENLRTSVSLSEQTYKITHSNTDADINENPSMLQFNFSQTQNLNTLEEGFFPLVCRKLDLRTQGLY